MQGDFQDGKEIAILLKPPTPFSSKGFFHSGATSESQSSCAQPVQAAIHGSPPDSYGRRSRRRHPYCAAKLQPFLTSCIQNLGMVFPGRITRLRSLTQRRHQCGPACRPRAQCTLDARGQSGPCSRHTALPPPENSWIIICLRTEIQKLKELESEPEADHSATRLQILPFICQTN